MMIKARVLGLLLIVCSISLFSACGVAQKKAADSRIRVLFDTDANNELDDQHAMAYLFFNGDVFDVVGVTVNATLNGGDISGHYQEAERVMKLCNVYGKIPLLRGANDSFAIIRPKIKQKNFDGHEAVDFIIQEAHKKTESKLVLLPVGKLTNIALALEKDPTIASKVRIVWLGSNYPEPGEYNQDNDIGSINYILNSNVPFEIATVRYGKPSGTAAIAATRYEINQRMPGLGPVANEPVTGRHGGTFTHFGDYSINLFKYIKTYDEAGTRALFDMAAVAIVKNPAWSETFVIPAPELEGTSWKERTDNKRTITIRENFKTDSIMNDFYERMKNFVLVN